MQVLEVFLAQDYEQVMTAELVWIESLQTSVYFPKIRYDKFKVNIPSLYPLKTMNDASENHSISNIYLNKFDVANYVKSVNYVEVNTPKGVTLPMTLKKGTKFLLICVDDIPSNGVLTQM